jgi:uncharacterized iron-regulated protein
MLLRIVLTTVSVLILVLTFSVQAAHETLVFKTGDLRQLSLNALLGEIEPAKVITIGEQHDNTNHHMVQLLIISAIHEAGRDIAIGFEQFGAHSQKELSSWTAGETSVDDLFKIYSRDWEPRWWNLYLPLFRYARAHEIPMVGLNVPREIVRQVAEKGFSSLNSKQRGQIKVLSCSIDEKYQEALRRVLGQKGKGSEGEEFNHFCEAQVVWDTSMAINAVDYMKANPEKTLVILAGNFHAWKRGIPEQIRRIHDAQVRSILPSEDPSFFSYDAFIEDSDYVWRIE